MPNYNPVLVKKLERILADMKAGHTIQVMDNGKWVDLDPTTTTINLSWTLRPEPHYRWYTLQELLALAPEIKRVWNTDESVEYSLIAVVANYREGFEGAALEFGAYSINTFNPRCFYTTDFKNQIPLGVLVEGTYDQD